jgi:hypothetical protein
MTSKLKTDVLETVSGSGTIALTNQLSGMTSASVPSGSVLQVVSNTLTTVGTTTSSTMAALGLSQSITPISTSSKVYALVTGGCARNQDDVGTLFTIYRGSSDIKIGGNGMVVTYQAGATNIGASWSMQGLDSPSTTSATTYSVYWRTRDNGNTSQNNWLGGETTITLMEIAG